MFMLPTSFYLPETTREEWLHRRMHGVGGSDIGKILGVSSFENGTPTDVWLSKLFSEHCEQPSTRVQRYGLFAEPFMASEFSLQTGRNVLAPIPAIQNLDDALLLGSPDALLADEDELDGAEWKAPHSSKWRSVREEVPTEYVLQCNWYMGVSGLRRWFLVFLVGSDLVVYELKFNAQLFDYCRTEAHRFWETYVVPRTPPPESNPGAMQRANVELFPRNDGTWIEPNPELVEIVKTASRTKADLAKAEWEWEKQKAQLQRLIGKSNGIRGLVQWKQTKTEKGRQFKFLKGAKT